MLTLLVRRRWLALALLVLAVGSVAPFAARAMVPDNSLTVWFLDTDPELQAYQRFQDEFGNDEVILILVEEPGGVFTHDALVRLRELAERIESVDGIHEVQSIASALTPALEGGALELLVPTPVPDDPAVLAALERGALAEHLLRDRLVSADARKATLWVRMAVMGDVDEQRDRIVSEVRAAAREVLGETPHALGGIGVIYAGLNEITLKDFSLFVGLGWLVMFVLVWLLFRSLRVVAAAVAVVTLASVAALGVYGLTGHRINGVTVVLPTLILVLGIADAVHFPTAFRTELRARPEAQRFDVVVAALRRVAAPCILTTVTTMAGFLVLTSSPMAVIRELGAFAAIGVGVALLASFVTMAVACMAAPADTPLAEHGWIDGWLERCRSAVERRPALIALLTLMLAGTGFLPVRTDTYTLGYLPDDHPVVRDHETIEREWGPYCVLEFLVEPAAGRRVDDPEIVEAGRRFVARAEELVEVGAGAGLHDIAGRAGAASGDARLLAPFIARDGALGRITLFASMMSARALSSVLERLERIAEEELSRSGASVASLVPAGYPALYVTIIDYVLASQVRSFFLALATVFVLMLVWLRSLRLALIAMIPNVFPVLVMRGVMSIAGIDLDVATATVAAIVLGVAIDDTIHFLHHWREAERTGKGYEHALRWTYARAGRAAVATTFLLVLSYPVLMLASVKTVVYFGLLTTVAAAAALFGDLFVLPLCLKALPSRMARAGPEEQS